MYTVKFNEKARGWDVINQLGYQIAKCNGGDRGLTQATQRALTLNTAWLKRSARLEQAAEEKTERLFERYNASFY